MEKQKESFSFDVQSNMITTNGGGAGSAFLGIEVAEAVETIGKVISWGKPLARQLKLAAGAEEAVLVPRLVTVCHPSRGDRLVKERKWSVEPVECGIATTEWLIGRVYTMRNPTAPSCSAHTAWQTASRSRARRSCGYPWGWSSWCQSAAGISGTWNRSRASCSPYAPSSWSLQRNMTNQKVIIIYLTHNICSPRSIIK